MNYKVLTLLFVLFVAFGCSEQKEVKKEAQKKQEAYWPLFRGNSNLSGISDTRLPDNLKLEWSFKTGADIIASPVVGNDKVYIGSSNGNVYALDFNSGKEIWKFNSGDDIEASALLIDSTLFVGNLGGEFFALNANSGSLKWKTKVSGDIRGSANYVKVSENKTLIFVGSYDNKMYCFDFVAGEKIWEYKTKNYINGAPATDGKYVVFGGCDSKLHIVNVVDGSSAGEVKTGSYIPGSSALVEGFSYLGKYDSRMLKIDVANKEIVWQFKDEKIGGAFFSTPAIGEETIVVGCRNRYFYCLDKNTGAKKWSFRTQDEIDSSPVIAGEKVIFGSADGRLYILNRADGRKLWSYEIGASITSSPAVTGGKIIIGAEDGTIYSFGGNL